MYRNCNLCEVCPLDFYTRIKRTEPDIMLTLFPLNCGNSSIIESSYAELGLTH